MKTIIEVRHLVKTFQVGEIAVHALRGIDLKISLGEYVAIIGSSGSGKSTLMNLLGCLDTPTEGEYWLDGDSVGQLGKNRRADIRNKKIGFVFQGFNLLPRTTALENVEMPLFYNRTNHIKHARKAAVEALSKVGLDDRLDHMPNQLSGGQQQRVAIARALVNHPAIVLADEPTGNLDSKSTREIINLFNNLNKQGVTIIIVTHEREIAASTNRIVEIKDGLIVSDTLNNGAGGNHSVPEKEGGSDD